MRSNRTAPSERLPRAISAVLPAAALLALTLSALTLLAGCTPRGGGRGARTGGVQPGEAHSSEAEASGTSQPVQMSEVSFRARVAPIFAAKCTFCHHPENAVKVDLSRPFDPQLGIINRPNTWTRSEKKILVVPGDAEASALVWKVEQSQLAPKIDGDPMPWNIPRLTERELADLSRWISDGARNDEFYRTTIRRIFGDGVSLGSRGGKCSYCHYPGAAFGPDLTDPFHPQRGAVGLRSAYGDVRVVPGNPGASLLYAKVVAAQLPGGLGRPMPLHFERLSAEEQRVVRAWIDEGAKDN